MNLNVVSQHETQHPLSNYLFVAGPKGHSTSLKLVLKKAAIGLPQRKRAASQAPREFKAKQPESTIAQTPRLHPASPSEQA